MPIIATGVLATTLYLVLLFGTIALAEQALGHRLLGFALFAFLGFATAYLDARRVRLPASGRWALGVVAVPLLGLALYLAMRLDSDGPQGWQRRLEAAYRHSQTWRPNLARQDRAMRDE